VQDNGAIVPTVFQISYPQHFVPSLQQLQSHSHLHSQVQLHLHLVSSAIVLTSFRLLMIILKIVYAFGQKILTATTAHRFRRLLLRRERKQKFSATRHDLLLVELVENLFPILAAEHQSGFAQDGQVMRNGRLRDVHFGGDFVDRPPFATTETHDLLAGLITDGPTEIGRFIVTHADNI
jgi:hypothetical protein